MRNAAIPGAMSHIPIIDPEEEEKLSPQELSDVLIKRVFLARKADVPVNYQYKTDFQDMLQDVKTGKLSFPLTQSELTHRAGVYRASTVSTAGVVGKGVQSVGQAGKALGKLVTTSIGSVPGSKVVTDSIQSLASHGKKQQMPDVPEDVEEDEAEDMAGFEVDVSEPEREQDDGF